MFSPLGGYPWAPRPAGTSGDLRSWANETDIVARSCGHGHPISSARGHKRRSSSETIPADPHSVGRRRRRPGRVRATDSNPLGTLTRHTPSPQRSPDTAPFPHPTRLEVKQTALSLASSHATAAADSLSQGELSRALVHAHAAESASRSLPATDKFRGPHPLYLRAIELLADTYEELGDRRKELSYRCSVGSNPN